MIAQREPREKIGDEPEAEMTVPSPERPVRRRFIDYPTPAERIAALDAWINSMPKHPGMDITDESLRRENLYEDRA